MYAVNAIYDGDNFKLKESVPINGQYEVIITFTNPIGRNQDKILKYFNTWDENDVNIINEIINERENFSTGRIEI